MDILFRTRKLQKQCSDDKEAVKAFGKIRAKRVRQRLDDIRAAANLEVMRSLPGRLHALSADREGQLSLDLDGPYRLILEPVLEDTATSADPPRWSDIQCVRILEITDTHD
jgi:proteic killer suppression protein